MKIGNPIYDVFFKYLMEDLESAKFIISTIISKEVISLTAMPQERTINFGSGMSVMRLDYKAVVISESGLQEKILIELQKAKNTADIYRFRRYLGDNYMNTDHIEGLEVALPITCIYFIGYKVPIENLIVKNITHFEDWIVGNEIAQNLEIMELLNHNS